MMRGLLLHCVNNCIRYSIKSPVTEDSQGLSFQVATLDHSGRLNIWVCMCVSVYISVFISVHMCVRACSRVCPCMFACVSVYARVYVRACFCMC